MKRVPKVTPDNAQEALRYFEQMKPNVPMMYLLHLLGGTVMRGRTHYEDGAREAIDEHLSKKGKVLLSHNHQSTFDPIELLRLVQTDKTWHPLIGKTTIAAKSTLLEDRKFGGIIRLSRIAYGLMRPQDNVGKDPADQARIDAIRHAYNQRIIDFMIQDVNDDLHVAIYAEGKRGKHDYSQPGAPKVDRDPTKIQPIMPGIGRLACGVNQPENLAIVHIGTIYGPDHTDYLHPTSVVSMPHPVPASEAEVVSLTERRLQDMVDQAVVLAA